MTNQGVVYCATTTTAYLEAALISAMALRQLEPELPITLISDQSLLNLLPLEDYKITPRFIEAHEIGNTPFSSRYIKTRLNRFSPHQETLFLDADILPLQPMTDLWSYLDQDDFAMVVDRLPMISLCDHVAQEEKTYTLHYLAGDATQFNSGVMLWRHTPGTDALFRQWHEEWQTFGKHDQLALIRAIHMTQVAVMKLPRTYNISPRDAAPLVPENPHVHLLHCWGGMVASGEFRQFAQMFHPHIAETVTQIFAVGASSALG